MEFSFRVRWTSTDNRTNEKFLGTQDCANIGEAMRSVGEYIEADVDLSNAKEIAVTSMPN